MSTTQTPARTTRRRLAVKVNPDSRAVVYSTVVLVGALSATSLAASFSGLISVAEWAMLHPYLRWTTPVMLDGAILTYTAAAFIRRARGESTVLAWTGVIAGTLLSALANAVHVILAGQPVDQPWVRAVGAGIAALSPILAALAIHQLADLAVAGPDEEITPARRTARRAARPTPAPSLSSSPVPTVHALKSDTPALTAAAGAVPAPRPAPIRDGAKRRTYSDADRDAAVAMAREGLSRSQISAALGISRGTIVSWTAGVTPDGPREVVFAGQPVEVTA